MNDLLRFNLVVEAKCSKDEEGKEVWSIEFPNLEELKIQNYGEKPVKILAWQDISIQLHESNPRRLGFHHNCKWYG